MKGFTLLEVLVTVFIFSLIILAVLGLASYVKTNYDTSLALLNLQRETRQGMSWLSRELREASWSSVSRITDANNNTHIYFDTPSASDAEYSVIGTQLQRTITNSTKIRANNIIGLAIVPANSSSSAHCFNITLTASKTFISSGVSRTLTFPLTQQVDVRNE